MNKIFINGKILIEGKITQGKKILFSDRILDIIDESQPHPEELLEIDLQGATLLPGFIDIHTHGAQGADTMDASPQSLETISKALAQYGVTRFLPTTMTMSPEAIRAALDAVRNFMNLSSPPGAKAVGVHLEGPFISKKYMGAQDGEHITKPNWEMIGDYEDIIKIITLAVEEDEDFQFIRSNPGIKLSIGHTDASFEKALESYDLGVTHCTHCFNAMTPLHHRKPGVVGACFTRKYETEFIADGVHIHPGFLNTFVGIIGKDQGILITDSIRASGMPQGEYTLGGQKIIVDESSSRLENGNLAGSILTMDQAIRNMKKYTSLALEDIVLMASLNPAKSIGMEEVAGTISKGKSADFVIMNQELQVQATILEGRVIYQDSHYKNQL